MYQVVSLLLDDEEIERKMKEKVDLNNTQNNVAVNSSITTAACNATTMKPAAKSMLSTPLTNTSKTKQVNQTQSSSHQKKRKTLTDAKTKKLANNPNSSTKQPSKKKRVAKGMTNFKSISGSDASNPATSSGKGKSVLNHAQSSSTVLVKEGVHPASTPDCKPSLNGCLTPSSTQPTFGFYNQV